MHPLEIGPGFITTVYENNHQVMRFPDVTCRILKIGIIHKNPYNSINKDTIIILLGPGGNKSTPLLHTTSLKKSLVELKIFSVNLSLIQNASHCGGIEGLAMLSISDK